VKSLTVPEFYKEENAMRKLLLVSVIAVFALSISGLCVAVEIATEAEMANVIEEPMVVGVPADGAAQGGPEPDEPSRGQFVWMPGPPVTGGGGEGSMQFTINIPQAGKYAIWGRVIAWDGNSDSLWVNWLPADPDENPQETDNTEFRWGVAQGNTWHWDRINHWLNAGTFEREWDLPAGETTLIIRTREDATMLDSIFITDNLSEDEAEVAPRVPSDADLQTAAVNPAHKLAVTWSSIKSAR
jgi:hypothetical protein